MTSEKLIAGRSLSEWQEFARQDDCLEIMVPSDLRQLIAALSPRPEQLESQSAEPAGWRSRYSEEDELPEFTTATERADEWRREGRIVEALGVLTDPAAPAGTGKMGAQPSAITSPPHRLTELRELSRSYAKFKDDRAALAPPPTSGKEGES